MKVPYGMNWRFRPGEIRSRPSSVATCVPKLAIRRVMYGQNDVSLLRVMIRPNAMPQVCAGALLNRRLLNGIAMRTT